jgi:hypothetical protein
VKVGLGGTAGAVELGADDPERPASAQAATTITVRTARTGRPNRVVMLPRR